MTKARAPGRMSAEQRAALDLCEALERVTTRRRLPPLARAMGALYYVAHVLSAVTLEDDAPRRRKARR